MIPIPDCVVCVAPADGRATTLVEPGSPVSSGQLVAMVNAGGREAPVHAPRAGRVGGTLAADRQAVSRGEGVVWLVR